MERDQDFDRYIQNLVRIIGEINSNWNGLTNRTSTNFAIVRFRLGQIERVAVRAIAVLDQISASASEREPTINTRNCR